MKYLHAEVHGRVTGVGFRWFTTRLADQFRLTGYVRNKTSTCVEVIAYGNSQEIKNFLADLSQGPRSSKVDEVKSDITEVDTSPYKDFVVRY